MNYLQKEEIIFINRKTIERHGGNFVPPFNILNENPLDYVVDAVSAEMFGEPLYPEIWDKAAVYFHSIITGHIFQDGNKRTGLESAIAFLKLNDYQLNDSLEKIEFSGKAIPIKGDNSTEILINFTLEAASGVLELEDCKMWFKENIIKNS
jgi:death on curing protein